jgi:MFS family permease
MTDTRITPETNGVRFGLMTAGALILYTLIAVLAGFFDNLVAGSLNLVILTIGISMAIANFKRVKEDRMPYLGGFGTGIVTAIVASLGLGFFFIAVSAIKPDTLNLSHARDLFGYDLSALMAFLAIILMGSLGGTIISLVAMQYFKSPDHKPIEGIE